MLTSFSDDLWSPVQDQGELQYAVLDAEDIRLDYPEKFRSKMELVQGMMELARTHRAFDKESHPALKKIRELEMKNLEEDWDSRREDQMEEISEKQKKWQQSPDIDIFDEEETEFFEHDEL